VGFYFLFVTTGAGERGEGRGGEGNLFAPVTSPKGEILDVLAAFSIILVFGWLSYLPRSHDNVLPSHRERSRIAPCSNILVSRSAMTAIPVEGRKEERKNKLPKVQKKTKV